MLSACDETDIEKGTPSCVRQKIINLARISTCKEGGASVLEYTFQGQTVYSFNPDKCAVSGAEITDENCNTLGYIGGRGFVVNLKINGEPFSNAKYKRTIWEQ
ncbi:hypothetical protein DNI29_18165 [Hymenobacter sediminis]|uniref:DUF6970 domain-containing protein n=1 Tax=Hymenobacter sediminis TaxID=2218621 RepID=UPI000F4DD1E7|nr:hypothetical protein [Hymenobacter sediminis]RPD45312.1 hypothetical protein DNI29_18165 [Hymenobacter sediminis]